MSKEKHIEKNDVKPNVLFKQANLCGPRDTQYLTRVVEYPNGNKVVQVQRTAREPRNFSLPLNELPDLNKVFNDILEALPIEEED